MQEWQVLVTVHLLTYLPQQIDWFPNEPLMCWPYQMAGLPALTYPSLEPQMIAGVPWALEAIKDKQVRIQP